MAMNNLDQLPDKLIPGTLAPNPILDRVAENRTAKAKALHLPGIPLSVARRAPDVASSTGVLALLLVGLLVKLNRKVVVRIGSTLLGQSGLSEDQLKRAVAKLSEAGLISVSSGPGKRREITLIDAEYLAWLRVPKKAPTTATAPT